MTHDTLTDCLLWSEGLEIDPLMYTNSNRKSGSANSLSRSVPCFFFRFRLQRLPGAIYRCFSTFRSRPCSRGSTGDVQSNLGNLRAAVTPAATPTTPSSRRSQFWHILVRSPAPSCTQDFTKISFAPIEIMSKTYGGRQPEYAQWMSSTTESCLILLHTHAVLGSR